MSDVSFRYWAFISYSHQDNRTERAGFPEDRWVRWAEWLHEALETFPIPAEMVGRVNRYGEPIPARLCPVFRDEAELPTSSNLGRDIREALEKSRFLIVLCSPRSAVSQYVNEEIAWFKRLGRGERILPLILDGEPNASDGGKQGIDPSWECFPPALRYAVAADGAIETTRRDAEPICADVRTSDARQEVRLEEFAAQSSVIEYHKLKLVAGMLGVGFDELVQRDKARQIREAERRAEEERARRRELTRIFSDSDFALATELLERDDVSRGCAWLARSLRNDPANPRSIQRAAGLLRDRDWILPLGEALPHEGKLWGANFSPDGKRALTASEDGTARLWDATTGEACGDPLRHPGMVRFASYSPDGARIVTVAWDGESYESPMWLWDAASGEPLHGPIKLSAWLKSLHFSPDGTKILTACGYTAQLWDLSGGRLLCELAGHREQVQSAEFSPDGRRIVTAGQDRTARLWDAQTGRALGEPICHGNVHYSAEKLDGATFSPDGTRILTSGADSARLWDAGTRQALGEPMPRRAETEVFRQFGRRAQFSPDGRKIALLTAERAVQVFDAATSRPLGVPMLHEKTLFAAEFSPDGTKLVTAGFDHTARVWDAATARPLAAPLWHNGPVVSAQFNLDGTKLVTAGSDNTARLWDLRRGRAVAEPRSEQEGPAWSSPAQPLEKKICVAGWAEAERTAILMGFPRGGLRRDLGGNSAQIVDIATGEAIGVPMQHDDQIRSATFNADGTRILTTSKDRTARVWDGTSGRALAEPMRHDADVGGGNFSPDGTKVVTATSSHMVRVWDAASGKPLGEWLLHQDWVEGARFSPEGTKIIAYGSGLRVWDAIVTADQAPVWLADAVEQLGGVRLDAEGNLKPVEGRSGTPFWAELRRLDGDDDLSRLARWFVADRATRTISPNASMTVAEFIAQGLREGYGAVIEEACMVDPGNPLILISVANFERDKERGRFLAGLALKLARLGGDAETIARVEAIAQDLRSQLAPLNESLANSRFVAWWKRVLSVLRRPHRR
jgi:WD40 repeat protein